MGDVASMEYAAKVAEKVSNIHLQIRPVKSVAEAQFQYGVIDVYDMGLITPGDIPCDSADPKPFGLGATALGGEAAFQYVVKVIELAMSGEIDATITNALSKEAINMAGHHYSGHTEIYADYTHTSKYTMMLVGGWYDIVVVMYHDQGHIPLKVKGFVYNKAEGHWDAVAGVNVTLGLPIIRASVDHGTGFGHAGDGHANELSLINAMDYGIRMANAKAEG